MSICIDKTGYQELGTMVDNFILFFSQQLFFLIVVERYVKTYNTSKKILPVLNRRKVVINILKEVYLNFT